MYAISTRTELSDSYKDKISRYSDIPTTVKYKTVKEDATRIPRRMLIKRGCTQKFPDWPPGARTANGTAFCH
jgi:hypothetical protein